MITNKDEILAGAKEVFFVANLDGYVGNGERSIINKTPDGYTTIEFAEGDYRVVDRYCSAPHSDKSAGTTTIFYDNSPVWWMSYDGAYPPEVIPFLILALREAYELGFFVGGRGPEAITFHERPYLKYQNIIEPRSTFKEFRGRERILDMTSGDELGYHEYRGMSLI